MGQFPIPNITIGSGTAIGSPHLNAALSSGSQNLDFLDDEDDGDFNFPTSADDLDLGAVMDLGAEDLDLGANSSMDPDQQSKYGSLFAGGGNSIFSF